MFSFSPHATSDDQNSWICSHPCQNSSLSLKNGTIEIKVSGYYYINAQVYYIQLTNKSQADPCKRGTVTLLRNEGNGKLKRKLSEAARYEVGSVSINRIVHLKKNDSISLKIDKKCMMLSTEDWDTYWEIISL